MAFRLVLVSLLICSAAAIEISCPGGRLNLHSLSLILAEDLIPDYCSYGSGKEVDLLSLVSDVGGLLEEKTLPYWLQSVDSENGGYRFGETTDGPVVAGNGYCRPDSALL